LFICCFFFQAEDGIRDFCLSRGLGDVYKETDILPIALSVLLRKAKYIISKTMPIINA